MVAFHGYGAEHDRQLNRPGAFEETCLAVRRARECSLGTSTNVFLTKPGLGEFDRLLPVLLDLGLGQMAFTVAGYTPTARGRRYQALRPDLGDLLPIAQRVLNETPHDRETWSSLGSYTEAAWVQRARDGSWPESPSGTARATGWSAGQTSTCTPGRPASTGAATGTCAATAHGLYSSAPWRTAPSHNSSSTSPGPHRRSLNSQRSRGTPAARRSTSTLPPSATCGLIAKGRRDRPAAWQPRRRDSQAHLAPPTAIRR